MSENQHGAPEEEAGGYGTPTAEQESGGPDAKQFAQPREDEDFDAAGLNQNSSDGEAYQTGSPNLDHLSAEDQDSAGEPGAGRFGGTDDQLHAETDSTDPGFEPVPRDSDAEPPGSDSAGSDVPSADAEIDGGNAESQGVEPFSSESGEDAAGLPDGSGNNLSPANAPKDDDEESFDAG